MQCVCCGWCRDGVILVEHFTPAVSYSDQMNALAPMAGMGLRTKQDIHGVHGLRHTDHSQHTRRDDSHDFIVGDETIAVHVKVVQQHAHVLVVTPP